jgi:hypothetical protein
MVEIAGFGQIPLISVEQQVLTSNDYYTPAWIFDKLKLKFDLDPASPPGGLDHIPVKHFYTQKDDGLSKDWFGRVWMNPPFSKPQPWVQKFVEHGNGLALLPNSKSAWFGELWNNDDVAFFAMPSDLKFIDPKGGNGSIFFPTVMIAVGSENQKALENLGKVR